MYTYTYTGILTHTYNIYNTFKLLKKMNQTYVDVQYIIIVISTHSFGWSPSLGGVVFE